MDIYNSPLFTQLVADLRRDEGVRNKPYKDSVGLTTIGVGRNLDQVGLSDAEIAFLLENDIKRVAADLDRELPWWRNMTENRQRALANLGFNMGIRTLLGFKKTLAMLQNGQYDQAATNLLASKYATQVGPRATRIADQIRLG
ncbi:MAG: glycoside hydrolase family protein [Candidatus Symbiobacter sp.]|nr:glycoside hydrolase family protein [Candidatus Symbiobacter sp.]